MKTEAIQALQQFKEMHLAMEAKQEADTVSQSHSVPKPKRAINYPAHIKPLKERIMSALANGCRTPDSVATYCGESLKLVTLQLGRWVSRGMIGRNTNKGSGITRYYPHDIAKEKGFLTKPQPINRKKGKKVKFVKPRASDIVNEEAPRQMPLWNETANDLATAQEILQHEAVKKHCTFLENQVRGWQTESRKQAHEITKLQDALINARKTRDVTSEVTEVMEEVTKLRATVAYLESKLFGSK
jgi:hypothetical protein